MDSIVWTPSRSHSLLTESEHGIPRRLLQPCIAIGIQSEKSSSLMVLESQSTNYPYQSPPPDQIAYSCTMGVPTHAKHLLVEGRGGVWLPHIPDPL